MGVLQKLCVEVRVGLVPTRNGGRPPTTLDPNGAPGVHEPYRSGIDDPQQDKLRPECCDDYIGGN